MRRTSVTCGRVEGDRQNSRSKSPEVADDKIRKDRVRTRESEMWRVDTKLLDEISIEGGCLFRKDSRREVKTRCRQSRPRPLSDFSSLTTSRKPSFLSISLFAHSTASRWNVGQLNNAFIQT